MHLIFSNIKTRVKSYIVISKLRCNDLTYKQTAVTVTGVVKNRNCCLKQNFLHHKAICKKGKNNIVYFIHMKSYKKNPWSILWTFVGALSISASNLGCDSAQHIFRGDFWFIPACWVSQSQCFNILIISKPSKLFRFLVVDKVQSNRVKPELEDGNPLHGNTVSNVNERSAEAQNYNNLFRTNWNNLYNKKLCTERQSKPQWS